MHGWLGVGPTLSSRTTNNTKIAKDTNATWLHRRYEKVALVFGRDDIVARRRRIVAEQTCYDPAHSALAACCDHFERRYGQASSLSHW